MPWQGWSHRDRLDCCAECGKYLPTAMDQIGSATTVRIVCGQCWDRAETKPRTALETDPSGQAQGGS